MESKIKSIKPHQVMPCNIKGNLVDSGKVSGMCEFVFPRHVNFSNLSKLSIFKTEAGNV